MGEASKRTPLHRWHVEHGANMADFGGYGMPLWYASAKNEHLSVLTTAGMFDTSHMAAVMVTGPDAFELLQHGFTNDLSACVGRGKQALYPGRCVYGAFLDEKGTTVDDAIVFMLAPAAFMVVVNAGMGAAIVRHLESLGGKRRVDIADLTDRLGKIDVQGPLAAKIVGRVLADPDAAFAGMPYFAFKGRCDAVAFGDSAVHLIDGTPILLSRTGYTGEFGFEIFMDAACTPVVWDQIFAAGDEMGLSACGLAARDSLRAGAMLPLSHQDIGAWPFVHHPWEFALPFRDDKQGFTKAFVGSRALLNVSDPRFTLAFVGQDLRKVAVEDPARVFDGQDMEIGQVLTCVTDMGIGRADGRIYSVASPDKPPGFKARGLCCGFVRLKTDLAPGTTITLADRRRKIKVTVSDDVRPDRTARRPMAQMW